MLLPRVSPLPTPSVQLGIMQVADGRPTRDVRRETTDRWFGLGLAHLASFSSVWHLHV